MSKQNQNPNQLMSTNTPNLMGDNELPAWGSFTPQTFDEKMAVYNALNTPDERLADFINETISIKNIFMELVELTRENEEGTQIFDDETQINRKEKCPRIVIIDTKGVSYVCVSFGVYNALQKIMNLFGCPPYENGLKVKIKQVSLKNTNKMLSLEIVK